MEFDRNLTDSIVTIDVWDANICAAILIFISEKYEKSIMIYIYMYSLSLELGLNEGLFIYIIL